MAKRVAGCLQSLLMSSRKSCEELSTSSRKLTNGSGVPVYPKVDGMPNSYETLEERGYLESRA